MTKYLWLILRRVCGVRSKSQRYNVEVLIPMFREHPIITNKYYSFIQWAKSLEIKYYNKDNLLAQSIRTAGNLNYGVEISGGIPFDKVTNSTILGFIEAEGSFAILLDKKTKHWHMEINILQNALSIDLMEFIDRTINSWPVDDLASPIIKDSLSDKNINTLKYVKSLRYLNKKGILHGVFRIKHNRFDTLFYVIIPILERIQWFTVKYIDFIIFKITLTILLIGLHHLPEGYNILITLKSLSNTNTQKVEDLPWDDISRVLSMPPVYNIELPYGINSRNYAIFQRYGKKNISGVLVYDLEGSFYKIFKSHTLAAKYFNVSNQTILDSLKNNTALLDKYILKRPN